MKWVRSLIVALVLSCHAHAQSAEDKAAAEALFDEGKRLLEAGQVEAACKKLEDSDRLDPAAGTQLNLAQCYERAGRTASAWSTYRRAAATAKARGQKEREDLARQRASDLEPKLSRLTLVVPEQARAPGLELLKNGSPVEPAVWNQAVPVDPGTLTIEARAPGKQRWTTQVALDRPGMQQSVQVPPLLDDPAAAGEGGEALPAPIAPPPTPSETSAGSAQRTWGWVVTGIGVVGLAAGGALAYQARTKNEDSKDHCLPDDSNRCSQKGVDLRDEARRYGDFATIAGGAGFALLVTGIVLVATAPSERSPTYAGVRAERAGGSLVVGGSW
jgi:tetratricopeptide (TPR) repeat protein